MESRNNVPGKYLFPLPRYLASILSPVWNENAFFANKGKVVASSFIVGLDAAGAVTLDGFTTSLDAGLVAFDGFAAGFAETASRATATSLFAVASSPASDRLRSLLDRRDLAVVT